MPPVAGGVEELPPHAIWKSVALNSTAKKAKVIQRFRPARLPAATPINAKPAKGKNAAYHVPDDWRRAVVATGRAVVVIVKVEVSGLLLFEVLNASGLVEKAHVAPAGKPAEQDSETLFGKLGTGVTVTWYVAEAPPGAGTVAVFGLTVSEKSVTVTGPAAAELLAGFESNEPAAAVTVPLSLKPPGNGTVGVSTTVTVAVAPDCRVPMEHCTALPTGDAQLPGELVMELKLTPVPGRLLVNTTPEVGSGPAFLMVKVNVTELPTPI